MGDPGALDVSAISAAFVRRSTALCPDQAGFAQRLIADLQPIRWKLEWYLPWWLGQSLGVDPDVVREIVLGNVLGLAALRLRDDQADGEIAPADRDNAHVLSAALYGEAVGVYQNQFPPGSPFWPSFAKAMSQWERATDAHAPNSAAASGTRPRASRFHVIARRGAPLKVCATALCLLGDRGDIIPSLHVALDHALAAWVLFDDANDWEADLAAGRWNAFVARLAKAPQDPSRRDENRAAVLIAMLSNDLVRGYYAAIGREAVRAAAISDQLGLRPFSAHLRQFGRHSGERGAERHNHYRALTERATVLLFGDTVG